MSRRGVGEVQIYGVEELQTVMREFESENAELVKQMRSAVTRAVNKHVKPYLFEIAKKEYTAGDDELKKTTKISNRKATNTYGRVIRLQANRLQLSKFDVNPSTPPNQKGVPVKDRIPGPVVRVKEKLVPDLMEGVIVAKMDSGHIGLFRRLPGTKARPKMLSNGKVMQREKIKELISLSMSEMIRKGLNVPDQNKIGVEAIRRDITDQIRKNVEAAQKRYRAKMAQEAAQ